MFCRIINHQLIVNDEIGVTFYGCDGPQIIGSRKFMVEDNFLKLLIPYEKVRLSLNRFTPYPASGIRAAIDVSFISSYGINLFILESGFGKCLSFR